MKRLFLFQLKKKKILLYTVVAIVLVALLCVGLLLTGCSANISTLVKKNLSEYRSGICYGESANFNATFTTGKREDPYVLNGKKEKLVEFGVLTITFNEEPTTPPSYTLMIDTLQYSGKLERNPFNGTYVADICREVSDSTDVYLKVLGGGVNESVNLTNVSKYWEVSYKKALKIAGDEFSEVLQNYIKGSSLKAEVFLKIVGDLDDGTKNIYWYVCVLCQNGDTLACIVDPQTGEILARKDNLIA